MNVFLVHAKGVFAADRGSCLEEEELQVSYVVHLTREVAPGDDDHLDTLWIVAHGSDPVELVSTATRW